MTAKKSLQGGLLMESKKPDSDIDLLHCLEDNYDDNDNRMHHQGLLAALTCESTMEVYPSL